MRIHIESISFRIIIIVTCHYRVCYIVRISFFLSMVKSDRTNCTYSIREDLKRLDTDVILFNVAYEGKGEKKPRARNSERDDNRYGMARQTRWKMTAALTFFYLNKNLSGGNKFVILLFLVFLCVIYLSYQ
jgi:hypothetical protein